MLRFAWIEDSFAGSKVAVLSAGVGSARFSTSKTSTGTNWVTSGGRLGFDPASLLQSIHRGGIDVYTSGRWLSVGGLWCKSRRIITVTDNTWPVAAGLFRDVAARFLLVSPHGRILEQRRLRYRLSPPFPFLRGGAFLGGRMT